ncbi:hypothetical protein [Sulfolobus tengchongensis spindle-shaped virus 4]|nr:hypothetical protein [Sulfolobus tengchongensis spindle-shaped virus 4]
MTLFTSAGSVTTSTQAYVLPNIGAWTYASVQYPTSVSVIVNNTVQKLSVSGASVTVSASYPTTVIASGNLIPPPNAQVSVYNGTFNKIVISSTSTFTFSTQIIQSGLPTFGLVLPVWYYVSLGTGTIGVPLVQVPMILGNKLFAFLPAVESTGWGSSPKPYYQGNLLVVNSTNPVTYGQYIGWYFVPPTTTLNLTIHVVSFPNRDANPGIELLSPNVGNQSNDNNAGFYWLLVDFYDNILFYHGLSGGYTVLYSSLPQPNPNYPFTFSVIFTENSAGNVTVSEVGINGTYTAININTPFSWSQIAYVAIRGDIYNLYYVSYFAASSGPTSITFVSPSYIFLNSWASSYVVPSYLNTPYALPYSVSQSSAQVGQYTLSQGLNYVSYPFTPGYVATAILYYNSTPVLANLLSPYISYKFSSLTLSFSTATAAMFSNFPIPAPQLLSSYIPAGSILYQDPIIYYISPTTVTMYNTTTLASLQSSNASSSSATTTTPPPSSSTNTTTQSISPGQMQIVYNGTTTIRINVVTFPSVSVPKIGQIVAMPIVNSSGAFLYLYNYNQSANFNVSVSYEFSNGTAVTRNVPVNSIIPLPVVTSPVKVNIVVANASTSFNVTPVQLGSAQLAQQVYNAISNSLPGPFAFFGPILANVIFLIFALSAMLRNDLKLVGMGGIAYGVFIVPGLLDLGFPAYIIIPSAIIAIGVGFVALWMSKS